MTAQHCIVELVVADELDRTFQAHPFPERRRLLDLEASRQRQRFNCLHAAQERARVNGGDGKFLEDRHQLFGLFLALLGERPKPVIAGPVLPAARLGVPYEIDCGQCYGIHDRSRLRSSESQIFGHRVRASSAAIRSSAMSSPATNALRPPTRVLRSQACAVTASWCSPRIVCNLAAARAKATASLPATGATASAAYRARLARIRILWSSGSVGLTGSCLTADRSRRHGVVARAGSVAPAGWSASGRVAGWCAAATRLSSRST